MWFVAALIAEEFLNKTASQLTYCGLCELASTVKEEELCVFFRNNHFSTLYKHKVCHLPHRPVTSFRISHSFFNSPDFSQYIGLTVRVNISEQKSGTEWTKKRIKRELVLFTLPGAQLVLFVVHRLGARRILPELR